MVRLGHLSKEYYKLVHVLCPWYILFNNNVISDKLLTKIYLNSELKLLKTLAGSKCQEKFKINDWEL